VEEARRFLESARDDHDPLYAAYVANLVLALRKGEVLGIPLDALDLECGLLFTTRHGTPIDPRNHNRSFAVRCDKAGVRRIKVHDTRRTCATVLVAMDVHPRIAMQILRHRDIDVTMNVYAEARRPK
jgi:integrase